MIDNPKDYIKEDIVVKKEKPIVTDVKILRKPCALVTKDDDVSQIIQDLKDTLEVRKIIGLTANQIGYDKAISYVKIPTKFNQMTKKLAYTDLILINPKIVEKTRKILVKNEACVSLPRIKLSTDRYVFITVEYYDEKFELHTALFQDLESVCIQHEIDHIIGKLIFDRKHKDINKK